MDFMDVLVESTQTEVKKITDKCFSIATGAVKENWNQEKPGKVLVEMFYGEEGKTTTEWVRVMQPYSGNGYGNYFLPEVGTEVVVAYILGDVNSPLVLGSLWNSTDKLPENTANEKNSIKSIRTKGGHEIIFDETKDKEKIQINTNGKLSIIMEDKEEKIRIRDKDGENIIIVDSKEGQVAVNGKKKVILKANNKEMLVLEGTSDKITLEAATIELKANQAITLDGPNMKIKGVTTEIKSDGPLKAETSAILQLKGTLIKIN